MFADPDQLCPICLPVPGDAVQGTPGASPGTYLTHRTGCPSVPIAPPALTASGLPTIAPVPVTWPHEASSSSRYLCEVTVYAVDRKLLLSDCSNVVSSHAYILKTSSSTKSDHALLEFLVKVRDLEQVQEVMDTLGEVESVMSCERRFGSRLARDEE